MVVIIFVDLSRRHPHLFCDWKIRRDLTESFQELLQQRVGVVIREVTGMHGKPLTQKLQDSAWDEILDFLVVGSVCRTENPYEGIEKTRWRGEEAIECEEVEVKALVL